MNVLLISTYEMGRQPFGLASPAAWLAAANHQVSCADLAVSKLPEQEVREAGLIAFHLPMHTATRLAVPVIDKVRSLNPGAHLCCYGLYAPLNAEYLRGLGVTTILGGEFEAELVRLAGPAPSSQPPLISIDRLRFLTPDRAGLPALENYAGLRIDGTIRRTGYTEASRGCKHLCRHCPVVPVYQGAFRVVQPEVVLEDIRRQIAVGAEHITFGDPDFFNGPTHAVRLVEALHGEFPAITYDATIKIEHLRRRRSLLPVLRDTGCLFVTSAVESIDDEVLTKLDKGHTRRDFIAVVEDFRAIGLNLSPTFIPFTPWTTLDGYRELLGLLDWLDLANNVSPVQLALRLLIPAQSRLLELAEISNVIERFDPAALLYRWRHSDPAVDKLAAHLLQLVAAEEKQGAPRHQIFRKIREAAGDDAPYENFDLMPRAAIPYLDEPWYC